MGPVHMIIGCSKCGMKNQVPVAALKTETMCKKCHAPLPCEFTKKTEDMFKWKVILENLNNKDEKQI